MLINTKAHEFIKMIETTSMSKSYKISVFLDFYNDGNIKMKINEDDIYKSFYEFYHKESNKVDMLRHKSTADFEKWGKKEYVKLAKDNPVKFLIKTHEEFFEKGDNAVIVLCDELREYSKDKYFVDEFIDSVEYRRFRYYEERKFEV